MIPIRLYFYRLVSAWLPESRCFGLKCMLLRWAGAKLGRRVRIYSSARFVGTGTLEIGDDVHIGSDVFLSTVAPFGVVIGSHVDVGPQVSIITGSHKINPSDDAKDSSSDLCMHMAGDGCGASVVVSDGCWLGARSMLLPGVSLSRKTLVAAAAVVTSAGMDTQKCLLAGCPASVKKRYE